MDSAFPLATQIIQHWEQCRLCAYPDPATGADPWTIGWGATGPDIVPGTVWTQAQADARLQAWLTEHDRLLTQAVHVPLTASQRAALLSFIYNLGLAALQRSTLLRKLNLGDYAAAAHEFQRWDYANGKIMDGLAARRAAEAVLFARGTA